MRKGFDLMGDMDKKSTYVPTAYTLTNPYLTRTPHPANVYPLHNGGNKMPVDGSLDGVPAEMTSPELGMRFDSRSVVEIWCDENV